MSSPSNENNGLFSKLLRRFSARKKKDKEEESAASLFAKSRSGTMQSSEPPILVDRATSCDAYSSQQDLSLYHKRNQRRISFQSLRSAGSSYQPVTALSYSDLSGNEAVNFLAAFADKTSWCREPSIASEGMSIDLVGDEINGYCLGPVLMTGGFSIVRECVRTDGYIFPNYHPSHDRLIIRTIYKHPTEDCDFIEAEQHEEMIRHEIEIWLRLNHPNILPLLDNFETFSAFYTISPYCLDGNLVDLLGREPGGVISDTSTLHRILYGVVSAVAYLHENNIVHGDIKLENVFIDRNEDRWDVRLGDLGLVQDLNSMIKGEEEEEAGPSGSIPYCSPERLQSTQKLLSLPMDCWSLGILTYSLICGCFPFVDDYEPRLMMKIMESKWTWAHENVDTKTRECVEGWLRVDHHKRLTASEALAILSAT